MTIVVGVATPDGIVMAADSRTTSFPDGQGPTARHRIISDSADKLFSICNKFGVATFGDAFVGDKTIGGLMDEFVAQLDAPPQTVDELVEQLGAFFHDRIVTWRDEIEIPWTEDEGPRTGFLVAGYDDNGIGHIKEVQVPGPVTLETGIDTSTRGMAYRGQVEVIHRLIAGVDWGAISVSDTTFEKDVIDALEGFELEVIYPITLQDGVDFATFLIRTTVDMQRFSDGRLGDHGNPPACGGPTRVLAVKRTELERVNPAALEISTRVGQAEDALK